VFRGVYEDRAHGAAVSMQLGGKNPCLRAADASGSAAHPSPYRLRAAL